MNWRLRAACRDQDPDVFFPIGSSGMSLVQIAEAKALCGRCPVAQECLAWAVGAGRVEGVWGGTTENERRALRIREDLGS
ncbi:WhiB family transcriptional regulator [Actinacidiphila rubida]|uniref:Transcriptional regulator WhiB n=1 Tax=Actinacidiphila rubida TaxID=310780 RepID=A0A1H8K9P6_9ACTN|nr:WhiB family transcriptional regulator [Actinacidiphila rubida]SEN89148.1 WhiB family transcriptional regulator, redox-sensing transcriptional regulator [Actinacidiphila rubida]